MFEELEILKTAKEEKAYGWEALKAIAGQYGYEWESLSFMDKPEPTNLTSLNKLIKDYQALSDDDTTLETVNEPSEPKSDASTLINQGTTVSPGKPDRNWYEYRRQDGSTFKSYSLL